MSDDLEQTGVDVAAVYEQHFELLVRIAMGRFRIAEGEADSLAHDVFLSYLRNANRVIDCQKWLVGAICNASRNHLRRLGRTEPLDENAAETAPDPRWAHLDESIATSLSARRVYACLTPRCQEALRLRYIEGYSVPEVAVALGTTKKYAQKLISRCLEQAQRRSKLLERS